MLSFDVDDDDDVDVDVDEDDDVDVDPSWNFCWLLDVDGGLTDGIGSWRRDEDENIDVDVDEELGIDEDENEDPGRDDDIEWVDGFLL